MDHVFSLFALHVASDVQKVDLQGSRHVEFVSMVALAAVSKDGRAPGLEFARVGIEGVVMIKAEEGGEGCVDVCKAGDGFGVVELEDVRLCEERDGGVDPLGDDHVAHAVVVGEIAVHGEVFHEGGVEAVKVVEAGDEDVADVAVRVDEGARAAEKVEAAAADALAAVMRGGGVGEVDVVGLDEAERGREDVGEEVHGEVGAGAAVGEDVHGRDGARAGAGRGQAQAQEGQQR